MHGIIGCGRVAPNHFDGFRQVASDAVRWACDLSSERLEAAVAQFGVPRRTTDYREVLADPKVRSVSITVDHASHFRLVSEALRAGKHVLVEKPLALSREEAAQLVLLAESRNLTLAVVSQHRFDPVVLAVKQWLDTGSLGQLVFISAELQAKREAEYYSDSYWRGRWAGEGGSVLINQGYHCVDLVRWLAGPAESVSGRMNAVRLKSVIETEDTFCGVIRHRSGALSTLAFTVASDIRWRTRIGVVGTRGSASFDIDGPDALQFCGGDLVLTTAARALRARLKKLREVPPGCDYYGVSHRRQIAEFWRAIEEGSRVSVGGADGLQTLELILSLYASGRDSREPYPLLEPRVPAVELPAARAL